MDSIQQMQEWIQDCRDNHLECNVGTTSELPSRLLKLSWPEARAPSIKLEQPEPSKGYRYVALSHCWNFTNPLRTTKENQAAYLISSPWDELSEALQDSVMTAPYLGKYYAGIWQHNLLLSLQWEALDTGASSRGEKYVAPTFSWASRSGAVIWYLGSAEDLTSESRIFPAILDADCTLAGEDPFGQVSGGYIKLRGYITEMRIESKGMCSPDGRLEMTKEGTESCYVTLDSIQDVENLQVGASVVCLDIMRDRAEGKRYVSGLVILPVASQNGCYRRIGFSTMLEEHFKDSSTQEVIIV